MSNVINVVTAINAFNAAKSKIKMAIKAKAKRGMNVSTEYQRLRGLRYEGATLVTAILLTGWKAYPMSDDGSCAGFYTRPASWRIEIAPQTLDDAKNLIQPQFLLDSWHGEGFSYPDYNALDFDYECDIGTAVNGVLLLDNLGNTVAEATVKRFLDAYSGAVSWIKVPSKDSIDIAAMLKQADELDSEAAYEGSWDNFESARSLREKAAAVRRQVEIVENVLRLAA